MTDICHRCVSEEFLSGLIQASGIRTKCAYCSGQTRRCWSIDMLANHIERAFSEHYIRTAPDPDDWQLRMLRDKESTYEWDREGSTTRDALELAAGISDQVIDDVIEILSERYFDFDSATSGEESEFDPDAHYIQTPVSSTIWEENWISFENKLRTEARYFSREAADHLTEIFGGIDMLRTRKDQPLVVEAGPGQTIEVLFRARVFQATDALKEALCRPDKHLGPPPARAASAGRMNARGIAVFYGATHREAALAEVRPPVGSDVALAAFKIIRPLRLLDLSALGDAFDGGSIFDPGLAKRLGRVAFLQTLNNKLTRPVMPDDQEFDYLPTQAVSDFLATENEPTLDGIIFRSTQAEKGENIVLFHKASLVKSTVLPEGTSLIANTAYCDEDGCYPDYSVIEEIPNPEDQVTATTTQAHYQKNLDTNEKPRPETLEVLPESLEVHHVNKVKVDCTAYPVDRSRRFRFNTVDF